MGFFIGNKNKFIILGAAAFSVAMVCFPHVTEVGSKSAILIWLNSIVPILLPFFIFSDFIKRTGNLERLPVRIYPLLIAFLSGYPMGAKVTADLAAEQNLSSESARHILSYSLVTGPAFLMGTIGGFLGSGEAGAVVAAVHYIGAILNGFFWRGGYGCCSSSVLSNSRLNRKQSGLLETFGSSIVAGFRAMALILAYLMFFMIGMNLLEEASLFTAIGNETVSSVLKGMLEMTAGCSMVGACNVSLQLKTVLMSFLVSFGGLSVIGQSASMAEGSGIGFFDILKIKVSHVVISGIAAVILSRLML